MTGGKVLSGASSGDTDGNGRRFGLSLFLPRSRLAAGIEGLRAGFARGSPVAEKRRAGSAWRSCGVAEPAKALFLHAGDSGDRGRCACGAMN
jgi:hypothetical protein